MLNVMAYQGRVIPLGVNLNLISFLLSFETRVEAPQPDASLDEQSICVGFQSRLVMNQSHKE